MHTLTISDLEQKLQVKRSFIYAAIASGQFPRPLKLGRASRWLESDIDRWLNERATQRDRQAPSSRR